MADIQIKTIPDLQAVSTSGLADFTVAEVLGYNTPGDMGGGLFYYDLSGSEPAPAIQGLTVIPTSSTGRWRRVIETTLYPVAWFGITSGTDQTANINKVLGLANVNEIVVGLNNNITINGTGANKLDIPATKKIIFQNKCKFIGSGEISGGMIDCDYVDQCFDVTLTVTNLQNDVVSVAWWGAKRDWTTDNTPIFTAAINACMSPPEIIVPASKLLGEFYYYFLNTLVIQRSVRIRGVGSIHNFDSNYESTVLQWKVNTVCIDCIAANPPAGSPNRIGIENIKIMQVLPSSFGLDFDPSAHGIKSNTFLYLKNVALESISGDGIHIDAQTGVLGNADQSRLEQIHTHGCNNGIYITGTDANIINLTDIDMSANRHWGVYDNSFLGCTYINPHFADNGKESVHLPVLANYGGKTYAAINLIGINNLGNQPDISPTFWREMPFFFTGYPAWNGTVYYYSGGPYAIVNLNAKGLLLNPYLESFQPPPMLNPRSMRINGLDEQGLATGGVNMTAVAARIVFGAGMDVASDIHSNAKIQGDIFYSTQGYFISYHGVEASSGFLALWSQAARRAYFENGTSYFTLEQTPPISDNSNHVPTTAWVRQAMPVLGNAVPVSGSWLTGQIVLNNDSTSNIIGWKCTVGGNPGTWVTIGVTTNNDIEITDSTKGIILKSPDGTRYRIKMNNGGTLNITTA